MYGDKPCYFIGILALPRGALKQNIMYLLQWGFSHMLILHLSPGRAIIISSAWATDDLLPAPSGDTWRKNLTAIPITDGERHQRFSVFSVWPLRRWSVNFPQESIKPHNGSFSAIGKHLQPYLAIAIAPYWYSNRDVKDAKDMQEARCGHAVPPPFAEALWGLICRRCVRRIWRDSVILKKSYSRNVLPPRCGGNWVIQVMLFDKAIIFPRLRGLCSPSPSFWGAFYVEVVARE